MQHGYARIRRIWLRPIFLAVTALTLGTGLVSGPVLARPVTPRSAARASAALHQESSIGSALPAGPAGFVARSELLAALRAAGATPLLQRLAEQAAAGSVDATTPKITTGALTGVLTGAHGRPLSGACVTAVSANRTVMALTGRDGRYLMNGLPAGRYVLSYRDCARPGRYFEQWSGGAAWPSLARSVTVSAGHVRAVPLVGLRPTDPAALLPSRPRLASSQASQASQASRAGQQARKGTASISGVVTGAGKPVPGICVEVDQLLNGFTIGFDVSTSRSGRYIFRNLAKGRYQITFAPILSCSDPGNWLQQFYRGATSVFPPDRQTTIRLRSGQHLRHIDARLKRGSQISGTVTSRNGSALSKICVDIFGRVREGFIDAGFVTGKHGRYAWHGVFPGRYTVNFIAGCGNKGNFAPQWWPHSATFKHAKPVLVTGTKIQSRIDAVLRPGAAIAGRVTIHGTGRGVGQVCVDASNSDGSINASATTGKDGRYRIKGLGTGKYFVVFDPTCGNLNLLFAQRFATATDGKTTALDVSLRPGAGISGRVQDAHGHSLDGICVTVSDNFDGQDETETGNGTYSLVGLTPGETATVEFTGGCDNNGNFAPQFYHSRTVPALADPISLKAGVVTHGIDATMRPGGTISGIVTDAAGHRLNNVCVSVFGGDLSLFNGFFEDLVFTSNGRYSDSDLAPGPYLVDFGCGFGQFGDQWFRAQPNSSQADVVSVGAGVVTSGISAALHRSGAISGVVTNTSGRRLSNICVSVVNRRTGAQLLSATQGEILTGGGRYAVSAVPPGLYDVQFSDCGFMAKYGSQWYSGKRTEASATPVRVTAGPTTTGIDATMALGGFISGRVVSNHGSPLSDVCVFAVDQATGSFGFGETGRRGRYTVSGLSTGSYALTFDPCNGQNLISVTRSATVRVTAPHGAPGADATMRPGGVISGSVSFDAGSSEPLAFACVEVVSPGHGPVALGLTGVNGGYIVKGLATGSYRVLFVNPSCFGNTGFAPQWFRDKPTESSADPVPVTAGSTTGKISARLQLGGLGAISGRVTRGGGAAVSGECVTAFPQRPSNPTFGFVQPEIAVTSKSGTYSLSDLVPGRYKVRFDLGCGATGLATQWWQGASSQAVATVITVAANATVTGINAVLKH